MEEPFALIDRLRRATALVEQVPMGDAIGERGGLPRLTRAQLQTTLGSHWEEICSAVATGDRATEARLEAIGQQVLTLSRCFEDGGGLGERAGLT